MLLWCYRLQSSLARDSVVSRATAAPKRQGRQMKANTFRGLTTGMVACAAIALASPAYADTSATKSGAASQTLQATEYGSVDEAGYAELVTALVKDGAKVADGDLTYNVEGFGTLTMPVGSPKGGPNHLSGGGGFTNPYISFNNTDQRAILAGSGVLFTAAICAIPAVGLVACAVAGAIVAAAYVYLGNRGICPSSKKNLRVYIKTRAAGCYA